MINSLLVSDFDASFGTEDETGSVENVGGALVVDPVIDDAGVLNENAGLVVVCCCELELNEKTGPFDLDSEDWAEGLKENGVTVAAADGALTLLGLN